MNDRLQVPPGPGSDEAAADPARLVYLSRSLAAREAAELLRGPSGSEVALTLGTGRRVRLVREWKEDPIAVGGGGDRPAQAASAAPDFARIHRRLRGVLAARAATRADACAAAASAAVSAGVSWQCVQMLVKRLLCVNGTSCVQ